MCTYVPYELCSFFKKDGRIAIYTYKRLCKDIQLFKCYHHSCMCKATIKHVVEWKIKHKTNAQVFTQWFNSWAHIG